MDDDRSQDQLTDFERVEIVEIYKRWAAGHFEGVTAEEFRVAVQKIIAGTEPP